MAVLVKLIETTVLVVQNYMSRYLDQYDYIKCVFPDNCAVHSSSIIYRKLPFTWMASCALGLTSWNLVFYFFPLKKICTLLFALLCPPVCKPEAIGGGISVRVKVEQKERGIFSKVYLPANHKLHHTIVNKLFNFIHSFFLYPFYSFISMSFL